MKYRPDIDGLRAVAVLSVLIFHVDPKVLPGGFVGVDVFFVISGYLISIILWNAFSGPSFSFLNFYARRANRLLPALYATILCTLFTALAWFPQSTVQSTAVSAYSALASVSNIRFSLQAGYFDTEALSKPLLHTWSLAVEEQFYLVWPFMLKFIHKHQRQFPRMLVLPVIALLAVVSEIATRQYSSFAYFLAPFRFYEFIIGAALHLFSVPASESTQQFYAFSGGLAMVYSLFSFSGTTRFPGLSALIPTIATALLIQSPRSSIAKVLSFSPVTVLGKISYSVYLVHWPLIVAVRLSSDRELIPEESVFLLLASLAMGYGLHHAVETRFRSGKSSSNSVSQHAQSVRTMVTFAGLGLLLCAAAYWATGLAQFKHERMSNDITVKTGGASLLKPIPGMNMTSLRMWHKRFKEKQPWEASGGAATGVENYETWRMAYMPKRKPPKARMLLIGDSHMGAMSPAFMRIAIERDFEIDARMATGCPLLFGTQCKVFQAPKRTEACFEQQKEWEKFIETSRYDYVVMAARWQWLFEDSVYGSYWMDPQGVIAPNGKVPPRASRRREIFEAGLRRTVRSVLRTGAHVVLVSQVPSVGKYRVRGCLERPSAKTAMAAGRQPAGCLGVIRETALTRSRFIDGLINRLGNEFEGVTAAVPSRYWCDNWEDKYCRSVFDGQELYKDATHITPFGSLFFEQRWREDSFSGHDWSHRNANVEHKNNEKNQKRQNNQNQKNQKQKV